MNIETSRAPVAPAAVLALTFKPIYHSQAADGFWHMNPLLAGLWSSDNAMSVEMSRITREGGDVMFVDAKSDPSLTRHLATTLRSLDKRFVFVDGMPDRTLVGKASTKLLLAFAGAHKTA
jgi:hypothetical protein